MLREPVVFRNDSRTVAPYKGSMHPDRNSLRRGALAVLVAAVALGACGGDDASQSSDPEPAATTSPAEPAAVDRHVKIGGGRSLYVSCIGRGTPTVVMEAGDADTGDYYGQIASEIAGTTRACFYDRANLGQSSQARGPRGLRDLVGDLERLLEVARIPGPYVLVGSSGGGYIVSGYALANPTKTAGLVLFDTFAPDPNPPKQVVEETDPDHPDNVERRDFLQVENDAWDARRRLGDFPMKVVTVDYGDAAAYPAERRNVKDQRGWLVLSSRAEQVVVDTGHDIVYDDPELATKLVLETVKAAG
jgi:pimeloyl-ACP methyl ester carboxylesterase